jgi:thiol-disulfide isomerase/thioredoxin
MNLRMIFTILIVCVISLNCSPKPDTSSVIEDNIPENMILNDTTAENNTITEDATAEKNQTEAITADVTIPEDIPAEGQTTKQNNTENATNIAVSDEEPLDETIEFAFDPNTMAFVTFKLEGKTLPGKPKIAFANDPASALFERWGIPLGLNQTDPNTWVRPLPLGDEFVVGWIADNKKLFGYCSKPFKVTKNLVVTFSPGMPTIFEYDLTSPPKGVSVFPVEFFLPIKTVSNGTVTYLSWGATQTIDKPGVVRIDTLTPGTYRLSTHTVDFIKYQAKRNPCLYDIREIEIKPGIVNRFEPNYPVIDTTAEANDLTIRGTFYDYDKSPLPNTSVEIIPNFDDILQPMPNLYYPPITTDPNGKFEFTGVRPDTTFVFNSEYTNVILFKDSLKAKSTVSVDLVKGMNTLPLIAGTPVQDLVIDWKDGSSSSLSDFTGKTLVLNFWATWSEPSRNRASRLNTLAESFPGQNDVHFIDLNLDYDRAIWEKAVNNSEWKALRHGWFEFKKNAFVLNKHLPYSIVIDKNGIIRAKGPDLDIKGELEKILKP